jgi:serine protease AprX
VKVVRNRIQIFVWVFFSWFAEAQANRYMVFFRDKAGTPYSMTNPSAYLSQKALDRRAMQGISIVENDLPVNPAYVTQLSATGAEVIYRSKWFNAAMVSCDASLVTAITALSFVSAVELVAPGNQPAGGRNREVKGKHSRQEEATSLQLLMLGIDRMHEDGFRGEGISIAVFDSGFSGVNVTQPFASIFTENRYESVSYNYLTRNQQVFNTDDHGTRVLSVIAAEQTGAFSGGADKALIQLYVTEDIASEYRIEEYYWLLAAERADSAGVQIINSSLGYNTFDLSSMNYTKEQMDGKTAVVTRAAVLASSKGIIVVTSAGNEGTDPNWRIVTAPADADDVLAVGSVNSGGLRSGSSSIGPTSDNRIKPDVMAQGVATSVIRANGSITTNSGTSFSAPLITSLVAGLWQRYPFMTSTELMEVVRTTASQGLTPDNLLGYGIPNYNAVVSSLEQVQQDENVAVFPNPVSGNTVTIRPKNPQDMQQVSYWLYTIQGELVQEGSFQYSWSFPDYSIDVTSFASSVLILKLSVNGSLLSYKLIRIQE